MANFSITGTNESYTLKLSGMNTVTRYHVFIQDINSDGTTNNKYKCVRSSVGTASDWTYTGTSTSTYYYYERPVFVYTSTSATTHQVGKYYTGSQIASGTTLFESSKIPAKSRPQVTYTLHCNYYEYFSKTTSIHAEQTFTQNSPWTIETANSSVYRAIVDGYKYTSRGTLSTINYDQYLDFYYTAVANVHYVYFKALTGISSFKVNIDGVNYSVGSSEVHIGPVTSKNKVVISDVILASNYSNPTLYYNKDETTYTTANSISWSTQSKFTLTDLSYTRYIQIGAASNITSTSSIKLFTPRTTEPKKGKTGYLFYTYKTDGGYNTNHARSYESPYGCTSLYNCTAYALGRINEIAGYWKYNHCAYLNAGDWWDNMPFTRGRTPKVGAIICWKNTTAGYSGAGHVAIVEAVKANGTLTISSSGWSKTAVSYNWRCYDTNATKNYGMPSNYVFQGFLYHPDLANDSTLKIDTESVGESQVTTTTTKSNTALDNYNNKVLSDYETVVTKSYNNAKGMDLLSSSTRVEAPFIIVQIGKYTFGSYTKSGSTALNQIGAIQNITYPNYMTSLNIVKTNGTLNTYRLTMTYQITPGDDPNLLDKVFSSVSETRKIILSYGDSMAPTDLIYAKEEAIITKITSNIDFASQRITYTIDCVSTALNAKSTKRSFPAYTKKGSDIILDILLKDNTYGLLDIFQGMKNKQQILDSNLIARDDRVITVEAENNVDTLTYLNHVVDSMTAAVDSDDTGLKSATYHLIILDDVDNEFGGSYFKVVKVGTTTRTISSLDTYSVDIGFPTSTLVTNFTINDDNEWALLYNYADSIDTGHYTYAIDNTGTVVSNYVNTASMSALYNKVTDESRTWWTNATKHPVKATLSIKGLLRPAILMSYVRVNTYFYGQKHISSGLYIITKQEDNIDASGYRTTLSLTRISGDDDDTITNSQSSTAYNATVYNETARVNNSAVNAQQARDEQLELKRWMNSTK